MGCCLWAVVAGPPGRLKGGLFRRAGRKRVHHQHKNRQAGGGGVAWWGDGWWLVERMKIFLSLALSSLFFLSLSFPFSFSPSTFHLKKKKQEEKRGRRRRREAEHELKMTNSRFPIDSTIYPHPPPLTVSEFRPGSKWWRAGWWVGGWPEHLPLQIHAAAHTRRGHTETRPEK